MQNKIIIKGARVNNLKNIDVEIPKDKFVVITGLSGSGKSSLAFNTIYAEGQRRFVDSLSSYARQFLGLMDKPDLDEISGLSPVISIDQRTAAHNPRSTVGTLTEIYDYLRLLFTHLGHPHCPKCSSEVSCHSLDQILKEIKNLVKEGNLIILAPFVRNEMGDHKVILKKIHQAGYKQVRLDRVLYTSEDAMKAELDVNKPHTVEVIVGFLDQGETPDDKEAIKLIESALDLSNGLVVVSDFLRNKDHLFSQNLLCLKCGTELPKIEMRSFSFNSPHGACPACSGLGVKLEVDPRLIITNPRLTVAEGAIKPWARIAAGGDRQMKILEEVARQNNFSLNQPVEKLSLKQMEIILRGTGDKTYEISGEMVKFKGVIPDLEERYKETGSEYVQKEIEKYMHSLLCPLCLGKRLKPEVLAVTVSDKSIAEVSALQITGVYEFFKNLTLSEKEKKISRQILKEIGDRLKHLTDVGLGYLTLDRSIATLSGGEAQRVRLANQIGSSLSGVIFILDEPSIGLHQRDNDKLITTLKNLRDIGNSVIVIEHDRATIEAADYVIDIGPRAGKYGGEIVAAGTPKEVKKNKKSLTGQYLSGVLRIDPPAKYRKGNGKKIIIKGAEEFNLKNIDVTIPLGQLVCVTGVSGSGKSTLITEILGKALSQKFYRSKDFPGKHKELKGIENIDKVINIDQSPIGRTPRSNPATYTGVFTYIRDLFVETKEAKLRGYDAGKFSFNVKGGGRCESCGGEGSMKIEMQFLPDVYVECEECHGRRYNGEALEVHYRGKNIADVLSMTVEEAVSFFRDKEIIFQKLQTLHDVGLGYIQLGQAATTLSAGEAQRVKLATELSRRDTGRTLYILDEPTTGLHFDDIKRLLGILNQLVDKENTVLIIEHNLDVIKCADWMIDLGPEGGDAGGFLVGQGTPKDVAKIKGSITGRYLKDMV